MANYTDRIKDLRNEAGLTQEQLAERLGVQRMTVIRWERGDNPPSEEKLLLLAQLFKVSTLYLQGYTDDRDTIVSEDGEGHQEKAEEERLLNRYRLLSPEMKKLVLAVVNNALIIERDRKEKHG